MGGASQTACDMGFLGETGRLAAVVPKAEIRGEGAARGPRQILPTSQPRCAAARPSSRAGDPQRGSEYVVTCLVMDGSYRFLRPSGPNS